jgi:hypothetical protein
MAMAREVDEMNAKTIDESRQQRREQARMHCPAVEEDQRRPSSHALDVNIHAASLQGTRRMKR